MLPTRFVAECIARFAGLGCAAGLIGGALVALAPVTSFAADDYQLGPDSMVQEGVPQGTLTKRSWQSEKIYPGTVRDYWVYVPKQYDGLQPANVMVFQDGGGYVDPKGQFRAAVVFDNLI